MLMPFSIKVVHPTTAHRDNVARQASENVNKPIVEVTAAGDTNEKHETPAPKRTLMEGEHTDLTM